LSHDAAAPAGPSSVLLSKAQTDGGTRIMAETGTVERRENGVGDATVRAWTGKGWDEWLTSEGEGANRGAC
jgi:hypothetical protein